MSHSQGVEEPDSCSCALVGVSSRRRGLLGMFPKALPYEKGLGCFGEGLLAWRSPAAPPDYVT